MINADTVDFLMPVAEPAPYVEATLHSVLAQTHEAWRLVVVLDGPAAATEECVRDVVPDKQLVLVKRQERGGISAALNEGLAACSSTFVARIDSDDLNFPTRLEHQLLAAREWSDTLVIGGAANIVDRDGNVIGELSPPVGGDIRRQLIARNQIVHSSALFRREVVLGLGGYSITCVLREDYELWLRLAALGPLGNCSEKVVAYRVTAEQSSRGVTTWSAMKEVGRARRRAGRALGISPVEISIRDKLWRAGQLRALKRLLGPVQSHRLQEVAR